MKNKQKQGGARREKGREMRDEGGKILRRGESHSPNNKRRSKEQGGEQREEGRGQKKEGGKVPRRGESHSPNNKRSKPSRSSNPKHPSQRHLSTKSRFEGKEGQQKREKKGGGMEPVEFWSICSVNGLPLSHEQMDLFLRYAEDLLFWNEKVNLISRRDTEHIWLHHILHSITPLLMNLMPNTGRLLDIGSGGGLPGIPMKIAAPKLDVTLLDSIAKKVRTTGMLASHITKHGLRAIRERSEELANDPTHIGKYDIIVARAVAPLVDLMVWSQPLLKPDGVIIALKGGALTDEIDHARGKFPDAKIEILDITLRGNEWFVQENKRIVRVSNMGVVL